MGDMRLSKEEMERLEKMTANLIDVTGIPTVKLEDAIAEPIRRLSAKE
jgi:hypothetical protein